MYLCKNLWVLGFILAVAITTTPGCAPPFSDLQSAKLVGMGNIEITPSVSDVSESDRYLEYEVQSETGLQVAYGLSKRIDARLRYGRIISGFERGSKVRWHVYAAGIKYGLLKDKLAIYVPVGFNSGADIGDDANTWEVHPTVLYTFDVDDGFELNPSFKCMLPLNHERTDIWYAYNLGLGLSLNPDKWVLRPEIGYRFSPSSETGNSHISLGLSVYP
jgi:hypothetical protein